MSTPGYREVEGLLQAAVGRVFPAAGLLCFRGRERHLAAFGDATLATWFDVASLTKALCTSVLCMQAVHAGRVQLEEEVLPGATLAQLLSHASGLPAWLPLHVAEHGELRDLVDAPSAATREAVYAAAARAPREPAGRRAVYSDLGFVLIGRLLEARNEARLDVQFTRVAAALDLPLGFRPLDAAAQVPASWCAPTRRETPARQELVGVVHDDNCRAMLGVAGHAGLFGTLEGVAALAQALLDCYHDEDSARRRALGLPAALVRRFWARAGLAQPAAGEHSTWGLGWDHPDPPPPPDVPCTSSAGRLWSRDGVGHLGFTGCSLWLDPGARSGVVLLSNRVCVPTPAAAAASQAGIKALRTAVHDAVTRAWLGSR